MYLIHCMSYQLVKVHLRIILKIKHKKSEINYSNLRVGQKDLVNNDIFDFLSIKSKALLLWDPC